MTISEAFTGTETVSVTEWSMTTDTSGPDAEASDGWFQGFVDFNALLAGDVYQFRVYEKVNSGGTQRTCFQTYIAGPQTLPVWVTPIFGLMQGWDMTLKKLAGTDRAIDWSIRKAP